MQKLCLFKIPKKSINLWNIFSEKLEVFWYMIHNSETKTLVKKLDNVDKICQGLFVLLIPIKRFLFKIVFQWIWVIEAGREHRNYAGEKAILKMFKGHCWHNCKGKEEIYFLVKLKLAVFNLSRKLILLYVRFIDLIQNNLLVTFRWPLLCSTEYIELIRYCSAKLNKFLLKVDLR